MYLKSIEIQGFKSFAHKIKLDFNKGITGVVGPNGSGKSNIADAVRWVLGEQSAKQLRGYKMEDVIFSGTETRKPLGYAYVSISLDNTDKTLAIDFEEVVIARRVYRSGESEYLINGSVCRLKDIQELFMDTGVGKEGYSIIGQGQIDKILSGKPEDRRELFDEAAGIVKYKKRKLLAKKSLEEEKQNLYRVKDIISEIKEQIDNLKSQSDKAKLFLKHKEEQKVLEVNNFLYEFEKINKNKSKLTESLKIQEEQYLRVKSQYEENKTNYYNLEKSIDELNKVLDNEKDNLNKLNIEREKYEGDLNLLNSKIDSFKKNEEDYLKRITNIEEEISNKEEELIKLNLEKDFIIKEDEKNSFKTDNIKKHIDELLNIIDKIKYNINKYKEDNIKINNDKIKLLSSIDNNKAFLEDIKKEKVILEEELVIKNNFNDELNFTINKIKEIISQLKEQIFFISEDIDKFTNKKDKLNLQSDNINKELEYKRQNYYNDKSKLNSIINTVETYEGYGNSVRKVMQQKARYPGIIGVIADIINVEKIYELAIETALGGIMQNVITNDEETAKSLINFLKEKKYGRATFLPLTWTLSHKDIDPKFLEEKGVINFAANLVKTDEKYKKLINYLLKRILVVDNIHNASTIAKKYNFTVKIVTLEGDLFNVGGSLSGGYYRHNSNLLSRKNEIKILSKQVSQEKLNIEALEKEKDAILANYNKLENHLVNMQNKYQDKTIELNSNKLKLESNISQRDENNKLIYKIKDNIINNKNKCQHFNIKIKESNDLIESCKNNMNKNSIEIDKLYKDLDIHNKQYESKFNEITKLNIVNSQLIQKKDFINENINRIKEEIYKLHNNINSIKEEIGKSANNILENINRVNILNDKLKGINKNIIISEKLIDEKTTIKEKRVMEFKRLFSIREDQNEMISLLDKDIFKINSQLEKLEDQLNYLINYMWDEYELTHNMVLKFDCNNELTQTQIKKRLNEIKGFIKDLGNVNVSAIDEYKIQMDRYNFLQKQKSDIIEAEEALFKIIKTLENDMKNQFDEHFKLLNKEFNKVFKELFAGGIGELELADSSDMLETGILINAQPPGKKLQNMMQLSGGEKALTAIALLFAIQNLKPSPFCLLDEIEAALDESNVKRFAKYLMNLSKDTQFIVITHRRGTMTVADTLYGITMHEKGVSTLVSVNLIENDLDK